MKYLYKPAVALAVILLSATAISALAFMFIFAAGTAHAFSCNEDGTDCSCGWGNQKLVRFTVQYSEKTPRFEMELPEAYFFWASRPSQGQERRDALIDVDGENFGPWPNDIIRHSRHGPYTWILISDFTSSIEETAKSRVKLALKTRVSEEVSFDEVDAQFGLKRPDITAHPKSVFKNDLYHGYDRFGNLTDLIQCSPEGNVPFPHCSQIIETELADLKISYSRDRLSQWREIARKARALLACAIVTY